VPVQIIDSSQASIDKGLKFADKLLEKDVGKGRISKEDAIAARERLTTSTKIEDLSEVDFVIEAVPVQLPIHKHPTTSDHCRKSPT
jgi:3-hydroxybutyryl-CoA dehydrogenase